MPEAESRVSGTNPDKATTLLSGAARLLNVAAGATRAAMRNEQAVGRCDALTAPSAVRGWCDSESHAARQCCSARMASYTAGGGGSSTVLELPAPPSSSAPEQEPQHAQQTQHAQHAGASDQAPGATPAASLL